MRKIITVLIHQIRLNIAHCKAIFSLYIVSLIVINYIVCFLYGAFNIHILEKRSEDLVKCTYLIDYKNPEKFENVQKLKSINYVGNSRFYIYESLFETEERIFSGSAPPKRLNCPRIFFLRRDGAILRKQN